MRTFHFTRYNKLFFTLSLSVIAGLAALTYLRGGFYLGIDFRSGLIFTVKTSDQDLTVPELEREIETLLEEPVRAQELGSQEERLFRVRLTAESEDIQALLESSREKLAAMDRLELEGVDLVNPGQAFYLVQQTLVLAPLVLLLILLYIWYRFRLRYAISAIMALLHDVLIVLGAIGAMQLEVSLTTVAAVLTVVGYSLNDTIVVFDRIRENHSVMHTNDLHEIIDHSLTSTLGRTLITSITTLMALFAMYFFTFGTLQDFALSLIIGVCAGTYSSIYIASSILLFAEEQRRRRLEKKMIKPLRKGKGPGLELVKQDQAVVENRIQDAKKSVRIYQTNEEIRLRTEQKKKKQLARKKKK